MVNINENEFNRILLKNLFRVILQSKKGTYPVDDLENMTRILADLFLKEFDSGNTPQRIFREHENVEEWLDEKIESFET